MGFGSIRKLKFLDTIIIEISIQDNIVDLLKLTYILINNLNCPLKQQSFNFWYKKLYVKLKKLEKLDLLPNLNYNKQNKQKIDFNNSWLSGYIDSKVSFHARWHKSKMLKNKEKKEIYISFIFWNLDQTLLVEIKKLFNSNSKIEFKEKWNLPYYKLNLDNMAEKIKIIYYLDKFKLKTKKKKKFKYWKLLLAEEKLYIDTGLQNFEKIEKIMKKFKKDDELSKI